MITRIAALFLLLATLAHAAGTLTVNPGDTCAIKCVDGSTAPPPVTVTCPDGSTHPAGYVCPIAPGTVTCPDGSVHNLPFTCPTPPVDPGTLCVPCPGFTNTICLSTPWATPQRMYTHGFGPGDAVVVAVHTGTDSSPSNNLPRVAAAEYGSSPSTREATLSPNRCDFGDQAWPGGKTAGNSVTIPFAVGAGANYGYYPIVPTDATYYFNIKNSANATCAISMNCDIAIDLTHPSSMAAGASLAKALAVPASAQTAKAAAAKAKAAK